jgi:hypothetical protein
VALQVQYVYVDLNLETLDQLQQHAGAFAVALPGAEGRALRAKAADRDKQKQLQERLVDLAMQLNLDERLDSNAVEYRAALGRLATQEVLKIQGLVEDTASSLAAAQAEHMTAGAAGKDTRSIAKRIKRHRTSVQQFLAQLTAWRVDRAADLSSMVQGLPTHWSKEAVEQICSGVFPWRDGDGNHPALGRLAAQYRDALAEVGHCPVLKWYAFGY